MKQLIFLVAALLISLSASVNGQTVICNFDDVNASEVTNDNFGDGTVEIIDGATTPLDGNSTKYVKQVKTNGGWGWERTLLSFDAPIDLSTTQIFAVDVYSDITTDVRLFLLQDDNDEGNGLHVIAPILSANTWSTVYFDFSDADFAGKSITKIQIGPAPGQGFDPSKDFFYDNVELVTSIPGEIAFAPANGAVDVATINPVVIKSTLALTTDGTAAITDYNTVVELCEGTTSGGTAVACNATSADNGKTITITPDATLDGNKSYYYGIKENAVKYEGATDFITNEGATFTTEAPLIQNDICNFDDVLPVEMWTEENDGAVPNAYTVMEDTLGNSTKLLKLFKGNHGWGRVVIKLAGPIDLATNAIVSLDVYAPEVQNIRLFLLTPENNEGMGIAKEVAIPAANEWTTMFFDFSDAYDANNPNHKRFTNLQLVVNPNGWNVPNTYLFDDIKASGFIAAASEVSPADGAVDVPITQSLEFKSNYSLQLADGSKWADMDDWASFIQMYEGTDANGTSLSFDASVNDDSTMITIEPSTTLSPGLSYFYTINENKLVYVDGSSTAVPAASAGFTTLDGPYSEIYTDFDDNDGLTFASWAEAGFLKVANPMSDAVNSSANVGAFIYGAAADQGIESGSGQVATVLGKSNINFALTPYFKMKVLCEQAGRVVFKIQNDPDWGNNIEQSYNVTEEEAGKWVDINFSFSGITKTNMNRIVLFFDRDGSYMSKGDTCFFDSIYATNVPPPAAITYSPEADADLYSTCVINSNIPFKMANGDKVENEDLADIVRLKKGAFADGTDLDFVAQISPDKKKITVIPSALLEVSSDYSFGILNDKLTFDNFDQEAVVDANSSFTSTDKTFAIGQTYIDFDGVSVIDTLEALGDPAGVVDTVADPEDATNQVLKFEKGTTWSGWERVHLQLEGNIDVSSGESMFSMRILSTQAGFVRFKVSDIKDDGGNATEVDADILLENAWQTLYFNFVDDKELGFNPYAHLLIFPDGGNATARTYYIDDVKGISLIGSGSDINEVGADRVLEAYPNPTNGLLNIVGVADGAIVKVYSLDGQLVKVANAVEGTISLEDLQQGMYFVSAQDKVTRVVKK